MLESSHPSGLHHTRCWWAQFHVEGFFDWSVCLSVCLSVCRCVRLYVSLTLCLSLSLSLYLSLSLSPPGAPTNASSKRRFAGTPAFTGPHILPLDAYHVVGATAECHCTKQEGFLHPRCRPRRQIFRLLPRLRRRHRRNAAPLQPMMFALWLNHNNAEADRIDVMRVVWLSIPRSLKGCRAAMNGCLFRLS